MEDASGRGVAASIQPHSVRAWTARVSIAAKDSENT